MKKRIAVLMMAILLIPAIFIQALAEADAPIEVKVLILPKFESGDMAGDFPGEAQYDYESYCDGGEEYSIVGGFEENKLYVKDGVALYVTGMGKVNTALSLQAILLDARFDFSNAYVLSTGCAGSAYEYGVMGDVFVITAAIDCDLGHHADIRDSVNMDVFMNGATPENLWDPNFEDSLASDESIESADIFATAMENNFKVGSVVIEAILNGTL